MIEAEGSPMGPLIRAVNYIADQLAAEFPTVAVDTLCARAHHHQPSRSIASLLYGEACSIDPCAGRAYQWSRHPPSITHPRENVIIRLCSIECNFGAPLTVRPTASQCFVATSY